jgi:hypothetical protein
MEIVSNFMKGKRRLSYIEEIDNKKTVQAGQSAENKNLEIDDIQK